jgi:hypothetical protein
LAQTKKEDMRQRDGGRSLFGHHRFDFNLRKRVIHKRPDQARQSHCYHVDNFNSDNYVMDNEGSKLFIVTDLNAPNKRIVNRGRK